MEALKPKLKEKCLWERRNKRTEIMNYRQWQWIFIKDNELWTMTMNLRQWQWIVVNNNEFSSMTMSFRHWQWIVVHGRRNFISFITLNISKINFCSCLSIASSNNIFSFLSKYFKKTRKVCLVDCWHGSSLRSNELNRYLLFKMYNYDPLQYKI